MAHADIPTPVLRIVLRAVAVLTALHATACVLVGTAVVFGSCGPGSTLGLGGVALGLLLASLGYVGAFAAGGLWALEERGRRAAVAFTLALALLGVACVYLKQRFSLAGAVWQAVVLAVLVLPASKRACQREPTDTMAA